jgi:lipopolysaccharide export system protein LptA
MTRHPGSPFLRPLPGVRTWSLLLVTGSFLAALPLLAAPKKRENATRISPALDLLPEGSTLKNVSIPRYDQDKNPAALLRAGLMKVINEHHVSGQNVELRVFNKSGEQRLKVHMGAAEYFVSKGILNATEVLTISGDGIKARGTGAVFHLDSRQVFIHGPATTTLSADSSKKLNTMNTHSRPLASAALLGLASLAIIAAPEPVPSAELESFTRQSRPEGGNLHAEVAPTRQVITRDDQLSQALDIGFRAFANKVRHPEFLTIAMAEPIQPPRPEPDPNGVHITCEGGMYLDVDKGQVVYLKDIVVKHPRFTINCAKELKIFLEQTEAAAGKPKPSGPDAFGDIKNIVATGGVKVVRKDDKGRPLIATAETASHDAKTGDIVLRGGYPMVQQGKNFIRAREAGLYIRIYENGNVYAQPGKWETGIADLKDIKDKKAKP